MNDFPEPTYLFVYGTFMKGMAHSGFLLESNRANLISDATIGAQLYDTGAFPAAVFSKPDKNTPNYQVAGEIYTFDEPWTALSTIDQIEGFNKTYPDRSLFRRNSCEAKNGEQSWKVQVYIYNQPVDGMTCIKSGSYREFINSLKHGNADD